MRDNRRALIAALPPDPENYLEQGVCWFVEPLGSNATLERRLADWQQHGQAQLTARFGDLMAFRLLEVRGSASGAPVRGGR
jgi:hypothetical protein